MIRSYRGYVAGFVILGLVLSPALISLARADLERSPSRPEVPAPQAGTASVRILGVNDLHGNLLPPIADVGHAPEVGGVAYLDAHMDRHRRPGRTVRAHAGDMVGGSPLISSHFHDEPTVLAMNEMGFDVGTPGNHEFDEGGEEMLRLVNGGRRTFHGGASGGSGESSPSFPGASFPYVAANTLRPGEPDGEPVLPSYIVLQRDGARLGFIGVTTPTLVGGTSPGAEPPFRFEDISEAVNRSVGELRADGVEAIVVLAHSGGEEVIRETSEMSGAVDLVLAGHTHEVINERVEGKLVVEAGEYGRAFSVVDLRIDRRTGDVTRARARVLPVRHGAVRPDDALSDLAARFGERVAPISERVVARAATGVSRAGNASGESALGDLVADAQRKAGGAQIAFVNPAGLRADVGAGPVTYGELFAVQPFGDDVVRMRLSGAAVLRLLEQQHRPDGADRALQVSGLRYALDPAKPAGSRVTAATLADGAPLDPRGTYTVVADDFLASGGDGFSAFREGGDSHVVGRDVEILSSYLGGLDQPFVAPDPEKVRRISREG